MNWSDHCSPSRHGAKTWVTLWSRDMGDTFYVEGAVFCGHAVENTIGGWGALALDAGVAPEGKVGWGVVPNFWCQTHDGLERELPFYAWRGAGFPGSFAPAQADAAPVLRALDLAIETVASKALRLGAEK